MAAVPTAVPTEITAGDTLSWKITLGDYPASAGWVLTYALVNAAGQLTITAAASGDDHLVTVTAATSAAYAPGTYSWQAYVTKTTERYRVGNGMLVVLANLAAQVGGLDLRTPAKVALDKIDAWLKDPGTLPFVSEYEIAGRHMKYADVLAMRSRLAADVGREENAAKGIHPRYLVRRIAQ